MMECRIEEVDCATVCSNHALGRWILVGLDPELEQALRCCFDSQDTAILQSKSLSKEMRLTSMPQIIVCSLAAVDRAGRDVLKVLSEQKHNAVVVLGVTDPSRRFALLVDGVAEVLAPPINAGEIVVRVGRYFNQNQCANDHQVDAGDEVRYGDLRIDRLAHRVFVSETEVHLSTLEYRLLNYFADHDNRMRTREQLLREVWGIDDDRSRTVDTHVARLRVKLSSSGHLIQTVRGLGYRFSAR